MSVVAGEGVIVVVCVKWVDLRREVDELTGASSQDERTSGWSPADEAAVELALDLAKRSGGTVTAACVGAAGADRGLRELLAIGVDRSVRFDAGSAGIPTSGQQSPGEQMSSRDVAANLATVAIDADWVICGDHSVDRGSGSVPAFLAHELGAAQALGLVTVDTAAHGGPTTPLRVTRRLGGGRSEVLDVVAPGVLSLDGSVARLRRASLASELAATNATIDVRPVASTTALTVRTRAPLRPRPRGVVAPQGDSALDRVVELTGAHVDRTPPRTIEATPVEAANAIVEQLQGWGYLAPGSGENGVD